MSAFLAGTCCAYLTACGFPRPLDVDPDGADDSGDGANCFGSFLNICLETVPTAPLTISTASAIETDSPLCARTISGGADYCVIAATNITIAAPLRGTGTRPLVLFARDTIVTTALIDVASHRSGSSRGVGAGGNPSVCAVAAPPQRGGGHAGGSFVGVGGSGGVGSNGAVPGSPAAAVPSVTTLRGGCSGQNAGAGDQGGDGGGAVFLIAGKRIDVQGGVNASGGGALGSAGGSQGGYGGGAGGMIGFEAPTITSGGLLLASGGGGGGGSNGPDPAPSDGWDPITTEPALGGPGAGGGQGGNGSSAMIASPGMAGGPGMNWSGGGGGGGGAGLIKAPITANLGTMVSPTPTP
jgi:hypothetical protein